METTGMWLTDEQRAVIKSSEPDPKDQRRGRQRQDHDATGVRRPLRERPEDIPFPAEVWSGESRPW
jgi:hypothetical protein